MKLLIIGAKGMLGSTLSEVFGDLRPECWDREEIDITNFEQTREAIAALQPDVIINAAAFTDVDAAETNRQAALAVNETGVRNLALAAKQVDATLIHYSTDYVFPGTQAKGYAEIDAPGPAVNVYGESKLAGERALNEVKPNYYLLRTAWLYGPNGKNFVETMLALANKHDHLNVVEDQWGSPTFTKDVARFTRTLLEEQYPFGIYHAVNSGTASWFQFAQKIFEHTDYGVVVKPTTSAEFPRPATRPTYSVLKNIQGPAMRPWQDALGEYMRERKA
ncbi:MAG: dTDP-4-dehydrorhamnose reductase [Candidatus Andersenbacteria bacterium]